MPSLGFRITETKSALLVLSGSGGVGESSFIQRWLMEYSSLGCIKNVTTHAKRSSDQKAGVDDYYFFEFVTVPEFGRLVSEGELAQWNNASKGCSPKVTIAAQELAAQESNLSSSQ